MSNWKGMDDDELEFFNWFEELEETQEDGYAMEPGAKYWKKPGGDIMVQALITGRYMRLYGHGQN